MPSPSIGTSHVLPLCSEQKVATRDGYAGASARLFLPFVERGAGYWFRSGQIPTFPGSTIPQDQTMTIGGLTRPDTFRKECCDIATQE